LDPDFKEAKVLDLGRSMEEEVAGASKGEAGVELLKAGCDEDRLSEASEDAD
jgi:hypothetical protein